MILLMTSLTLMGRGEETRYGILVFLPSTSFSLHLVYCLLSLSWEASGCLLYNSFSPTSFSLASWWLYLYFLLSLFFCGLNTHSSLTVLSYMLCCFSCWPFWWPFSALDLVYQCLSCTESQNWTQHSRLASQMLNREEELLPFNWWLYFCLG